ncbi:MAG: phage head-tail connector protein [Proteobacteria bacterium]|nr:phage head-tail connector protein [Pseudomonadota bacterium]
MNNYYPLTVTTPPVTEPVSLADARAHLRVDTKADDALVSAAITAARAYAEDFTHRKLITQTVEIRADGFPAAFRLPVAPVITITSIKYIDTTGTLITLAADQYKLVQSTTPPLIVPAYSVTWPTTRAEMDAIGIILSVGYGVVSDDVPPTIIEAIKLLLGHFYTNRVDEVTGTIVSKLTLNADKLLLPHVLYV